MPEESGPQPSRDSLEYMALMAQNAPLYAQIREKLRWQIHNGVYQPGERLPSEEEIAEAAKVNRLTARRAVSDLVNDGLLQRRPGVGTFVVARKILRDQSFLASFWEATEAMGMQPSGRLISKEAMPASEDIAGLLEISEGEPIYRIRRVRLADNEAQAYHIAHIPAKLFPDLLEKDLANLSLYALYRSYGYMPVTGEQWIEAQAADEEASSHLGVSAGSPLLFLRRITRTANGHPIEFVSAHLRSDRFVFYMPLHISGRLLMENSMGVKSRFTRDSLAPAQADGGNVPSGKCY